MEVPLSDIRKFEALARRCGALGMVHKSEKNKLVPNDGAPMILA